MWTYLMDTESSTIFIDYRKRMTKVIGIKYIYIYEGIFPNINHNKRRRFRK